jgi:hypothetical protein
MRYVPRSLYLGKLRPNNTRVDMQEKLKLFQNHTLQLIFCPTRCPKVFIHTEIILQIVFIVNENYLTSPLLPRTAKRAWMVCLVPDNGCSIGVVWIIRLRRSTQKMEGHMTLYLESRNNWPQNNILVVWRFFTSLMDRIETQWFGDSPIAGPLNLKYWVWLTIIQCKVSLHLHQWIYWGFWWLVLSKTRFYRLVEENSSQGTHKVGTWMPHCHWIVEFSIEKTDKYVLLNFYKREKRRWSVLDGLPWNHLLVILVSSMLLRQPVLAAISAVDCFRLQNQSAFPPCRAKEVCLPESVILCSSLGQSICHSSHLALGNSNHSTLEHALANAWASKSSRLSCFGCNCGAVGIEIRDLLDGMDDKCPIL